MVPRLRICRKRNYEHLWMCSPLALGARLRNTAKLKAEAASSSTHSPGTIVALVHHESELHIMTMLERLLQPALGHC